MLPSRTSVFYGFPICTGPIYCAYLSLFLFSGVFLSNYEDLFYFCLIPYFPFYEKENKKAF